MTALYSWIWCRIKNIQLPNTTEVRPFRPSISSLIAFSFEKCVLHSTDDVLGLKPLLFTALIHLDLTALSDGNLEWI